MVRREDPPAPHRLLGGVSVHCRPITAAAGEQHPAPTTTPRTLHHQQRGNREPPPRIAAKRPTLTYPRVNRPPAPAPSPRPHHRSSPLHPIKPTTTPCTRTRRILFPLPRGRLPHPATARIAAKPPTPAPLPPSSPAPAAVSFRFITPWPAPAPPPALAHLYPAPTTPYTRLLISPRTTHQH